MEKHDPSEGPTQRLQHYAHAAEAVVLIGHNLSPPLPGVLSRLVLDVVGDHSAANGP